jgi:hypothetical protein
VLLLLLVMAAGGSANPDSRLAAFVLLLPVISVEGAGVGGKLGRGMMGGWPVFSLMELGGEVETGSPASGRGQEQESEDNNEKALVRPLQEAHATWGGHGNAAGGESKGTFCLSPYDWLGSC